MSDVLEYYSRYDEEGRLQRSNIHKTEFLTTIHTLDKIIAPGQKVLDASAGTGAYSFYLADKGVKVTAGDIVPRFIDILEEKNRTALNKVETYLGDVRDLARFDSDTFDAVLCMGPLYHLKNREDRKKAVAECLRVAKSNGICVFAYINRSAVYTLEFNNTYRPINWNVLNDILHNGCSPEESMKSFYYSEPEEMEALMTEGNVKKVYHLGADGIGYQLGAKLSGLTQEEYDKWWTHHLETCEKQSLLGYSLHNLYIGRK